MKRNILICFAQKWPSCFGLCNTAAIELANEDELVSINPLITKNETIRLKNRKILLLLNFGKILIFDGHYINIM